MAPSLTPITHSLRSILSRFAPAVPLGMLTLALVSPPSWAADNPADPSRPTAGASVQQQTPLPPLEEEIDGALQEVRGQAFRNSLQNALQRKRNPLTGEPQQAASPTELATSKEPLDPQPAMIPGSVNRLTRGLQALKADYEGLVRNHERLQRNFERLSRRHKELLDRNQKLQGSMEELMRYNQQLQADVAGLKTVGEKLQENFQRLQQVYSEIRRTGGAQTVVSPWTARPVYRPAAEEPVPVARRSDPADNGRVLRSTAKFPPDFGH
jgi:hypothetical protein